MLLFREMKILYNFIENCSTENGKETLTWNKICYGYFLKKIYLKKSLNECSFYELNLVLDILKISM